MLYFRRKLQFLSVGKFAKKNDSFDFVKRWLIFWVKLNASNGKVGTLGWFTMG